MRLGLKVFNVTKNTPAFFKSVNDEMKVFFYLKRDICSVKLFMAVNNHESQ